MINDASHWIITQLISANSHPSYVFLIMFAFFQDGLQQILAHYGVSTEYSVLSEIAFLRSRPIY